MKPPSFVLDASIALAWCFETETDHFTDAVLDSLANRTAVVPTVWPLEIGNALVVAERRGFLDRASSTRFLNLLRQLSIEIEQESPQRMFGEILLLAREQQLSTYDASYLDLAMRSGLPLASRDGALLQAAERCGVEEYSDQVERRI
jgi:predicted nucleic acid-binding protein